MDTFKFNIASMFESSDYLTFRDILNKASSENSVKIVNGKIVYGKTSKSIPNFKKIDEVKDILQKKKTELLMRYSDVYDKIVISDTPQVYKAEYDKIVSDVNDIENLLDEIEQFIVDKNNNNINHPLLILEESIENNKVKAGSLIGSMKDNVHVERNKIKELANIHKQNIILEQQISDAENNVEFDYIIWPEQKRGQSINNIQTSIQNRKKSNVSKSSKIDTIKKTVKKLMVEKLN